MYLIKEILEVIIFEQLIEAQGAMDVPRSQLYDLIRKTNGKIFTVLFIKKDGSQRVMNCRINVKKYLHGGELPYDPISKGLFPVYDIQSKGYRMINLNTIQYVKMEGKIYNIK